MKKDNKEVSRNKNSRKPEEKISRKEAIKKTGFIAASAATMILLLGSPEKAQASSPAPPSPPSW